MKFVYRGKNVRRAINKGLKKLGITESDAEIEIVQEKPLILFGLLGGGTKVKIKPKGGFFPASAQKDKSSGKVEEYTRMIVGMIDKKAKVRVEKIKGSRISVNIDSSSKEIIIGKRGSTLDAVEYIVNLLVKRDPSTRVDVSVDCGGYKKNMSGKIKNSVRQASARAKKEDKPVKLEPMDSHTRKMVHEQIKSIEGVESESVGRGSSRRVVIKRKA